MLSFVFDKAVVLVVVLNLCGLTRILADDFKDFKQDEDIKRDARDSDGMWFGPRIGKRSLHLTSESDRQDLYRMLEAADALKYYYDQLRVQYYNPQSDEPETKVTKKVIFTPKLGRSAQDDSSLEVDFTPRLGRRRSEGVTPTDKYPDQQAIRFQPRLGRGGSMTFSPRLGRNLVYDLYSDGKVRVARSANKTKSN